MPDDTDTYLNRISIQEDVSQGNHPNDIEDGVSVSPTTPSVYLSPLPIPDQELVNEINITAPIYVPPRESLAIGLVPIDTVRKLEEYRSDEKKWETVMWAFIGAILGVLINWVTSEPIVISKTSLIIVVVFLLMALLSWNSSQNYKKRTEKIKASLVEFKVEKRPNDISDHHQQ